MRGLLRLQHVLYGAAWRWMETGKELASLGLGGSLAAPDECMKQLKNNAGQVLHPTRHLVILDPLCREPGLVVDTPGAAWTPLGDRLLREDVHPGRCSMKDVSLLEEAVLTQRTLQPLRSVAVIKNELAAELMTVRVAGMQPGAPRYPAASTREHWLSTSVPYGAFGSWLPAPGPDPVSFASELCSGFAPRDLTMSWGQAKGLLRFHPGPGFPASGSYLQAEPANLHARSHRVGIDSGAALLHATEPAGEWRCGRGLGCPRCARTAQPEPGRLARGLAPGEWASGVGACAALMREHRTGRRGLTAVYAE